METTSGSGAGHEPPVAAQPPPSPLSGAYLLIVVGEPHTDAHKQDILRKIANGFLSWDVDSCHVDLDKELQAIISAAPEGEEARNGERLIQFASENLVTEVLIQPQLNTLIQCIRNLLSSFTKHRHIIHAGYTFAGNGSWIVQDGTFSLADLIDALQEPEVQRVLRAYEHSVTVDIHCAPEGDWSTARLRREACTRLCRVRVNPDDGPSPAANIQPFVDYLSPFMRPQSIDQLLHPSDVVGNIRFSHPTLYVFPGGQGDAALFGINGFNMLVDGGFSRKACFWDFVRHLDRLDAVLMTRINNSNCHGLSSILRRKRLSHVYPQIGHFFCNLQERKQPLTPDEEKVRDPLLVNLLDEGQEIIHNLKHLQLKPHNCVRDSVLEPINLYHKVGHGKLDMYVISPARDSKELKEFLSKWHCNDVSLFNSVSRKPGDKDISFPFQNLVSICALLVWQPANPEDTITRILFPGSTPQHKIFEGLEKLRSLDFMKQPVCTAKTLSPSSSTTVINAKVNKTKSTPAVIDKLLPGEGLSKPVTKGITQSESVGKQAVAKTSTIPVSGSGDTKFKPTQPSPPKPLKQKQEKQKIEKDNKTEVDKNIEDDAADNTKQDKPVLITDQLKEKESIKIKNEKTKAESKPKKVETKITSRISERKPAKVPSVEKKDSVKSSPTTPKKSVESKINGVASKAEIVKSAPKPKLKTSPSSTPAKSTKEENNRKVVESKAKAAIASKTSAPKHPKRDDSVVKQKPDKKPIKKPLSYSPVKLPSKSFSPVKGTTKTLSKGKKDSKKLKGDVEKSIVTDCSTVSTPSTVDAETAISKEGKVEINEKLDSTLEKDVDSGKFEEKEKVEDDTSKDIDESVDVKKKVEEASVSEDVISVDKHEDRQIETSEKEYSEKEEEDEILIIEKVEIEPYGDDSVQDQESLESHVPDDGEDEIQKHLRDEAESEKRKDDQPKTEESQYMDKVISENDKIEKDTLHDLRDTVETTKLSDLTLSLAKEISIEKVLTPENREQIEEEVQEIITSATDFVAKTKLEQSKESSELSADGIGSDEQKTSGETKDLLSSPEKLHVSDKNFTDDDNKQDDIKDRSKEIGDVRYGAEESQPDEKISTTVESGATTAPTLPEDERIPLDEIKEGIEEKYDKEDTKEKETGVLPGRIEQPTTLPQVSVVPGGPYEIDVTQMLRDIVKTPDEVADLPVHEEVDGLYEENDFSRDPPKGKDDLLSISGKKDIDTKDEKTEVLPEKKETLELHEPITKEKQVSSKDKIDENGVLKADVKTDEEEFNEMKAIQQKLEDAEAVRADETDCKPVSKGLDLDIKHEMVLETEPVHSTLKAPEVAELVLVTPDSAPESPLHLLTEKKDKPTVEVAEDGKVQDHIIVTKVNESMHTIKHEEIEESLDTVTDLKKSISSPKTPPASPVLGDLSKEKNKVDIIPDILERSGEIAGISSEVIVNNLAEKAVDKTEIRVNLQDIPESTSPIQTQGREISPPPEEGVPKTEKRVDAKETENKLDEKEKIVSTLSESPEKYTAHSDVKKLDDMTLPLPDEEPIEEQKSSVCEYPLTTEAGESPKLEKEQTVSEKVESPKSISPVLSDKEDKKISEKDTNDKSKLSPTELDDNALTGKSELPDASPLPVEKEENEEKPIQKYLENLSEDIAEKHEKESFQKEPGSVETVLGLKDTQKTISPAPSNIQTTVEKDVTIPEYTGPLNSGVRNVEEEGKSAVLLEKPDSVTSIQSEESELKIIGNESTDFKKEESLKSISPEPSELGDSKTKDIEQSVETKTDTPKSISLPPSERGDSRQDTPKSISPVPSEKVDVITDESCGIIDDKKQDIQDTTPKSISPVPSVKGDAISDNNQQIILGKQDTPKSVSPVPSEKRDSLKEQTIPDKLDTPKSISPVPSVKGDAISDNNQQIILGKQDTPKSVSPVPSEKRDSLKEQTIPDKLDTPKSISPVPSDKESTTLDLKQETYPDKLETPKSISPVPSDKGDAVYDEKQQIILEKQDTPKSDSPAPSEKRDSIAYDKEQTITSKSVTPKSISPVPPEKEDATHDGKQEAVSEKQDTPKSVSPAPSEKRDSIAYDKEQTIPDKSVTPKSISPAPSDKVDTTHNGKQEIISEKQDSTKSISPVPSDKVDTTHDGKQDTLSEKQDTPKSVSPAPSEKRDSIAYDKEQTIPDKSVTPKSISPAPSDKVDTTHNGKQEITSEKQDSTKSISPVPSDKLDTAHDGKQDTFSEKQGTPKSVSPAPSEKRDSITFDKGQTITSKPVTPKSISPVPSDKGDITLDRKQETYSEKQDSPKSVSPAPSEKKDSIAYDKEQTITSKPVTPKSISPVPSEKEDPTHDGKQDAISEKQDSPKSVSPAPSEKKDSIAYDKEQTITSKPVTPKSISPVPSEKEDPTHDGKQDAFSEKQDTPKSVSPAPSEKRDSIAYDKEQTITSKSVTPKSISPVQSEKEDATHDGKQEAISEKQDTPKSVSPAPSEKRDSIAYDKEQTNTSKSVTPKSISPVPSEKEDATHDGKQEAVSEKQDTPKSVSPAPSEKRDSIAYDKEQNIPSKSVTPKSISPVPSEKEHATHDGKQEAISEKQDTPKSVSPAPSEKRDSITYDKEQTITSKSVTPKSISPVPSEKEDASRDGKQETILEKQDTPKSDGPVPSEIKNTTYDGKQDTISDKQDSPKSISPVPSEKGYSSSDGKEKNTLEKQDTPKSVDTLPSENRDSIAVDKEPTISVKSVTPKSISPVLFEKGDAISNIKDESDIDKQYTPKSTSPAPSEKVSIDNESEQTVSDIQAIPKSISPLPSERGDILDSPKIMSPGASVKEGEFKHQILEKSDILNSINLLPVEDGETSKQAKEKTTSDNQDSRKSASPTPSDKRDRIIEKHETVPKNEGSYKSTSPAPDTKEKDKEEGKLNGTEQSDLEKVDTPKSVSPVPSEKGEFKFDDKAQKVSEKQDTPKSISPVLNVEEKVTVEEIARIDLGKHDTAKVISPVPSDKTEAKTVDKEQSGSENDVSPKCISPLPSDKEDGKEVEKELTYDKKQDTPKCISPLPSHKGSSEPAEKDLLSKETHDSPKSISPVLSISADTKQPIKDKYTIETPYLSNNGSPTHSDKVDFKTDHVSITETEKADTELSEKDKIKVASHLEDGLSTKELGHDQFSDKTQSHKQDVSNVSGVPVDPHQMSLRTDLESVTSLDLSSSDSRKFARESENLTDDNQLGSSELSCKTISVSDKSETVEANVLSTGKDTVIETSLASKSIKTEKEFKSDSESIVPSNLINHGLDSTLNERSAGLSTKDSSQISSLDHRSTATTGNSLETKSGLQADNISSLSSRKGEEPEYLSSAEEEISASVHRMLVTGSSEDGGTETELCSSSVRKLSNSSCDKNLGNVAHISQEESSKLDQVSSFSDDQKATADSTASKKEADLPPEKTVITTTVYSTDSMKDTQINDSTKPSDIVKTITTTVTKTFGEHPSTDIKTTEDILPSGDVSSHTDIEKAVKKGEVVPSGIVSQSLKRELSDAGRSGTPASDLASERELETGGISTPHSDISSGQVSRAATHVWGESSEGRPDSRHCDSDDDVPCSPMSATSHMAQSPPQFDFDIGQHSKEGFYDDTSKAKDSSLPAAMTSSLYGSLPDDPLEEYIKDKQLTGESQMYSSMYVSKYGDEDDDEDNCKLVTSGTKMQAGLQQSKAQDIDFETAIKEHKSVRGEDLTVKYTNGKPETSVNGKTSHGDPSTNGLSNGKSSQPDSLEYQVSQSSSAISSIPLPKSVSSQPPVTVIGSSNSSKPSVEDKDPIEGWGKPLGLPPPPRNLIDSPLRQSTLTLVWNPADEWGIPLGLPSPAPPPVKKDSMNGEIDTEITTSSNKTTPKKVARRNAENNKSSNTLIGKEASNKSKHPESPVKRASNKDAKSKSASPVYMDLTYVPHHGNSNYTNVEFFKRIRARYYVFSGTEPSREVLNALLEAKQTWEDQDLEVTIIPTYDTDTLGYWVAENEDLLAKYKIDLSPSASRCTINLQDHETSCSAYRLEF